MSVHKLEGKFLVAPLVEFSDDEDSLPKSSNLDAQFASAIDISPPVDFANLISNFPIPVTRINPNDVQYVVDLPIAELSTLKYVTSFFYWHLDFLLADGFLQGVKDHLWGEDYGLAIQPYIKDEINSREDTLEKIVENLYLHLEDLSRTAFPSSSISKIIFEHLPFIGFTRKRLLSGRVRLPINWHLRLCVDFPIIIFNWVAANPHLVKVGHLDTIPHSAALLTVPPGVNREATFTKEELLDYIHTPR